jgi:HAD superfamily hydrolase (TIGR01549 family)
VFPVVDSDTNRLILRSFQHTFAACADLIGGVERIPDAATISSWFGEPLARTFKRFTDNEADVQTLITEYRSFNAIHHDELAAEFEGIEPAIRLMYQCGFKMAIVTSKVSHVARQGLKRARIDQYFSVLIGSDSVDQHKPHPAPALAALALLGEVPGPHVLMVGDAATDILCGKAAGCKTAAVGWSTFSAESLSMADYFPSDAAALRDLIMPPWELASGHAFPAGAVLGTWRADSAKVRSIVRHSICQGGVRHIDTARMYFNHTQIGEGIKDAIESGMVTRKELFITSKLMPSEMHPECVAELVDASLTELQLDYLDMFLIHWPCALVRRPSAFPVPADERFGYDPQRILDVWRVLETQVAAGKIRSLGVSNFSCTRLHESLLKHSLQCPVRAVKLYPVKLTKKVLLVCVVIFRLCAIKLKCMPHTRSPNCCPGIRSAALLCRAMRHWAVRRVRRRADRMKTVARLVLHES